MKNYLKNGLLVLGALALIVSCFLHQAKGNGLDFAAYYKAAQRAIAGQPFYVDEAGYAYKYAPITILYFLPFGFLPYTAARWLYALLHAATTLLLPCLALRLFTRKPQPFWGLVFAFTASFRFVDGEFRDSNFGLFIALFLVAGTLLLRSVRWRACAPAVQALGSVVKVHSLLGAFSFRARDRKTLYALVAAALMLLLIPNPWLWAKWWEQMQLTARYTTFSPSNFTLQGFYPFAAHFFGWNPLSHVCLLVAVPFALLAFYALPRFSLEEASKDSVGFFLTQGAWVFLALLCSPLPWQHTYSFLWVLYPVAYWAATDLQKRPLIAVALFLGLTPRDLVGVDIFSWLESRQSVFFALLFFWLTLVFQVRSRHGKKGPSPVI